MKKYIYTLLCILATAATAGAQDFDLAGIDTTGLYAERYDSLASSVLQARQKGSTLSKYTQGRVETITAAGLCKMACCNLAESFENSASVTVGYSDAVTGARQIRLLGLSGVYTQMLDENRPVMRGLAAPFGLSYVPGQWLESIQVAKGVTSVINGVESITGQINMEHRKPTDEKPLFINASVMSDRKADLNLASSLQLDNRWSTVLLGHVSGNNTEMDMNGDGFMDDPRNLQVNLSNRWLYYDPSGMQIRFGVRILNDWRRGGQLSALQSTDPGITLWQSEILNQSANGYLKVGIPLNEDNSQNIAAVLDWNWYGMASCFGPNTTYNASQQSGFANLLYQNEVNSNHKFTLGVTVLTDRYNEDFLRAVGAPEYDLSLDGLGTSMSRYGIFGEYTFHLEDKLSIIAGLRGEWYKTVGGCGYEEKGRLVASPRFTLKYNPSEHLVLRANAGRGLRYANPLSDNLGVLSTSKVYVTPEAGGAAPGNWSYNHTLEDALTIGGNLTWYFPLGASEDAYLSLDYFHTHFTEQSIVDYEYGGRGRQIAFYNLSDVPDGRSFTNTWQADFSCEPLERFTVTLTGRYSDARLTTLDAGLRERPMTSRWKGVLNLQYSTNLSKWIFDFTASANGPCRVYDFMKDLHDREGNLLYADGQTPIYPLLYAQVTRRLKGIDIYAGGENLTNFRQKNVIIGADPLDPDFDASCVWGPIMGVKLYAGVRITIWKTE